MRLKASGPGKQLTQGRSNPRGGSGLGPSPTWKYITLIEFLTNGGETSVAGEKQVGAPQDGHGSRSGSSLVYTESGAVRFASNCELTVLLVTARCNRIDNSQVLELGVSKKCSWFCERWIIFYMRMTNRRILVDRLHHKCVEGWRLPAIPNLTGALLH